MMETITNTAIGFGIAMLGNWIILPAVFGIKVSVAENVATALFFTVISIARQFTIRRLFNGRSVWQAIRGRFAGSLCKTGACAWCDYERYGR